MDKLMYSWLSCCAIAPSVTAISVWILFMFHIYCRHWTNVDLFLVLLSFQEILSSLCVFAYSVINVIRSHSDTSCSAIIWGITTIRIFQMSTITSMAIDRACILKWPYKYRFTVRKNQIKYHLSVLGCMSALVALAGVFARLSKEKFQEVLITNAGQAYNGTCTLHPFSWDFRYNVFITAIYFILISITIFSFVYVALNHKRLSTSSSSGKQQLPRPNSRISSVADLTLEHLGSTEAIAKFNTGSYSSLYNFSAQGKEESLNRKSVKEQMRSSDLRWSSVLGNASLCYAVNHGPSLIFLVIGMIAPRFWSPFQDNALMWFILFEGILLPFCLYSTDEAFSDAVRLSFKRRNNIYSANLLQKLSGLSSNSTYNEFVLIDKPYGALMSNFNPKSNTSSLSLVRSVNKSQKQQQHPQLVTNNGGNSALFQKAHNDYFPYLRKGNKLLQSDCNLPQLFPVHLTREGILLEAAHSLSINPLCRDNKASYQDPNCSINRENPSNHRLWRENTLWSSELQTPATWTNPGSQEQTLQGELNYYRGLKKQIGVENSNKPKWTTSSENIAKEENETLTSLDEALPSLDHFAVSANEDFEFHDARKLRTKRLIVEEDNISDGQSVSDEDTSIISSGSSNTMEYNKGHLSQLSMNCEKTDVGDETKRRGWQCFSASDLRLIENQAFPSCKQNKKEGKGRGELFSSKRSLSETNLLYSQSSTERTNEEPAKLRSGGSNESLNSGSTTSTWFQNKVKQALSKRSGLQSSKRRRNSVIKSKRQLRYKKNNRGQRTENHPRSRRKVHSFDQE